MVRAASRLGAAAVVIGVLVGLPITEARAQPSRNWPTYLNNGARTGNDGGEKIITSSTARKLTRLWAHHADRPISTQPIRVNGVVYYGSWDGYERAVNAASGAQRWAAFLGVTTDRRCGPTSVGVASTAVVGTIKVHGIATRAVFVGGGNGNFYALNASTGRKIWKTRLGRPLGYFLWSSPLLYHGSIYEGVASLGDCPLVRGGMVRMDAATGAVTSRFYTVPPGCTGAGVWGSPTLDAATGDIYFATGNAGPCMKRETLGVAVIRTDASLHLLGSWQVPSAMLPNDSDFGSTPTMFSASIGGVVHPMLGIQNKNGIYYAFDRYAISKGPIWRDRVAGSGNCAKCGTGSISPSAYNGHLLFIGSQKTRIGRVTCAGSIRAVRPSTGQVVWADCLRSGPALGAVTAVPGLAFVDAGNTIYAVGTNRGTIVWSYKDTNRGSRFWGAPIVSGGRVYVGNRDGNLYAFGTRSPRPGGTAASP
jgi:outer membrane protein assembly factor BamB